MAAHATEGSGKTCGCVGVPERVAAARRRGRQPMGRGARLEISAGMLVDGLQPLPDSRKISVAGALLPAIGVSRLVVDERRAALADVSHAGRGLLRGLDGGRAAG